MENEIYYIITNQSLPWSILLQNYIIPLILIVCFIGILFCTYMLWRNKWVYKQQLLHGNLTYGLITLYIKSDIKVTNDYMGFLYNKVIYNYNKMFNTFWCWNISKMVYNNFKAKANYNLLYENSDLFHKIANEQKKEYQKTKLENIKLKR